MIERLMHEIHFAVDPNLTSKEQAKLVEHFPIKRAPLRVQFTAPKPNFLQALWRRLLNGMLLSYQWMKLALSLLLTWLAGQISPDKPAIDFERTNGLEQCSPCSMAYGSMCLPRKSLFLFLVSIRLFHSLCNNAHLRGQIAMLTKKNKILVQKYKEC